MTNVKMWDAYYLEAILKGIGSVITIANDQLRNTISYLLSLLLETVVLPSDEYQKEGKIISKTAVWF